jgi:hypothetical protein
VIDLLVGLLGRRYCLACCGRLGTRTTVFDLTGGNRAHAVYGCQRCGTVTEVRVPVPGGAVVPRF